MKSTAKAYAPANISCIFQIHEDVDPGKKGSYGLGFTLDRGITAEVNISAKNEVYFNNKHINFPTLDSVLQKLHAPPTKINITSSLPLGCGFGLSGASALAVAYSLNSLLNLSHSNLELARIAHTAEVENHTGLGDVTNQYFGGFLLKLQPSSQFIVQKIPLVNIPVYCKYFSPIKTGDIISNSKIKEKINKSAVSCLKELKSLIHKNQTSQDKIKFSQLISISYEFAAGSGLLIDHSVINLINEIKSRNGHASMIMLGNAVFSDIPFPGSAEFKISNIPAYLK